MGPGLLYIICTHIARVMAQSKLQIKPKSEYIPGNYQYVPYYLRMLCELFFQLMPHLILETRWCRAPIWLQI